MLRCEAIEKLAEEMSPTACQEMVGCTSAYLEKTKGESLNDQDCHDFEGESHENKD